MIDLTQPWQEARFVAFDFETTGTKFRSDRVIEIGVSVFEGGQAVDHWQQLVDPGVPLPPIITEITSITDADLKGQPAFAEVAEKLLGYLEGNVLLAYNHSFDLGMLGGELRRLQRDVELGPCLDPMPFFWKHFTSSRLAPDAKLGTAVAHLGLDADPNHRADQDARAAGELLLALPRHVSMPERLDALLQEQANLIRERAAAYNYWGQRR